MEPSPPPSARKRRSIRKALELTSVSLLTNVVLAAVKIAAGVLGHSYALIADGIESSTDALTSLAVWGGFRMALQPPDADHPYGHGKAESLAGFVVALALIGAAIVIAINGVDQILHPGPAPQWFTLPVLAAVIFIKEWLARRSDKTGADLHSQSLKNEAWHHRSDAMSSAAAFVGISVALIGGERFHAADGCAALVAAVIIAINGLILIGPSLNEIMDTAPSDEIVESIRKIAAGTEGVREIEKCRVRKSGIELYVDIHVEVDGEKSVRVGHAIGHDVKNRLMASPHGIADVTVHVEPAD